MQVIEVMSRGLSSVHCADSVRHAARLMLEHDVGRCR